MIKDTLNSKSDWRFSIYQASYPVIPYKIILKPLRKSYCSSDILKPKIIIERL